MRAALLVFIAAAAMCIASLPFMLSGGHAAPSIERARAAPHVERAHDADEPRSIFGRVLFAKPPVESTVGNRLMSFDRRLEDGVARCAPEIFGYDRAMLVRLQSDWRELKPNLLPSWEAWLALDGVVIDERQLARCEAAFDGLSCDDMEEAWTECTAPFRGTLGEDDACDGNEQCASASCVGGACTAPNDCNGMGDCPVGMLCGQSDDGDIYTCVDPPSDGEPCLEDVNESDDERAVDPSCGPGRACDDGNICRPERRIGERCGETEPCAYDLYCDDDGRCVVDETITDEIEEEEEENRSAHEISCVCDPYRDGYACVDTDEEDETRCVPVAVVELGQSCDAVRICAGGLGVSACIDGKCVRALDTGDGCDNHDQCRDDLVCIDGACISPRHSGEECYDSDGCIYGLDCLPSRDDGAPSACGIPLAQDEEVLGSDELFVESGIIRRTIRIEIGGVEELVDQLQAPPDFYYRYRDLGDDSEDPDSEDPNAAADEGDPEFNP